MSHEPALPDDIKYVCQICDYQIILGDSIVEHFMKDHYKIAFDYLDNDFPFLFLELSKKLRKAHTKKYRISDGMELKQQR